MTLPRPRPEPVALDFAAIYETWFEPVWRTLRRLGVREAELGDAAQEVFVVVHRHLADYDPERPLRPWLMGITCRVAAGERRRARHRRERLDEDAAIAGRADVRPSPEALVEARQRRDRVMAALDRLDLDHRTVFVMFEMEGVPGTEIAEALGVPVNTVYSRLHVARQRFADAIRRLRLKEGEA